MTTPRRVPSRREWLWLLLPLAVLAIDFWRSPRLIENTSSPTQVSLVTLLEKRHVTVGIFHGHAIEVNVGNVGQTEYLDYLAAHRPNALTISAFVADDEVLLGEFGSAVRAKLKSVAPSADARLVDMLQQTKSFAAGDVRQFELQLTPAQRQQFPVDHLFIAVLEKATGSSNSDLLEKVFGNLLRRAGSARIDTLVLPAIGYHWKDENTMSFNDFFRSLLKKAAADRQPPRITFDLYSRWPTYVLEQAVGEINASAEQFAPEVTEKRLHRQDFRALCILVTICLLASSFFAPITFRNFLILSASYTGLFLGAAKTLAFLTDGWSAAAAQLTSLGVYLVLAALFPFICRWNPKDIFVAAAAAPPAPAAPPPAAEVKP